MSLFLRAVSVLLVSLLAVGGLAGPAAAQTPTITKREKVFGGLNHELFSVRLSDGAVARGNIVRFKATNPHLHLRPVLARDRIAGLETLQSIAKRESSNNALAGTNGGFWLPRPTGAPNGFAVKGGVLIGGQAQTVNGYPRARGAVAVQPDGRVLIDRLNTTLDLRRADGVDVLIDEVNLQPRLKGENPAAGELIVYDKLFGTTVAAPRNSIVTVIDGLRVPAGNRSSGKVRSIVKVSAAANVAVPSGSTVLLAHGTARDRVKGVKAGQTVSVRARPRPHATDASAWGTALAAIPAGPMLLRAGKRTNYTQWRSEAFSAAHVSNRHPRSAIGVTADGWVLMVTVDGRRRGHSAGMKMAELMDLMARLGARDALALDGGGSTTMTVEGAVRNRPSESGRSVANGLFVYHDYPFAGSTRIAGRDRFATAAEVAKRSHPKGAADVVIATGTAFPDALAGGPLAARLDAPLLLTARDHLPAATIDALRVLRPKTATILGGTAAVNNDVRRQIEARGIAVRRVAGANRYATAAAVGERVAGRAPALERVFVASGTGFADALSAAAPAGMLGAPVLLTAPDALPADTRAFLRSRAVGEIVIVGGASAVSADVERELRAARPLASINRLAGKDRYGTARRVNTWAELRLALSHDLKGMVAANGSNFPDALAGGPLAASRNQLLMIVPPGDVRGSAEAAAYLDRRQPTTERVTLLGGRQVLTLYQQWQLDQVGVGK
jgi:putative cell wall-binding protein/exopolysaccharide biosynthesis protein